jgi:hypothetical protein
MKIGEKKENPIILPDGLDPGKSGSYQGSPYNHAPPIRKWRKVV